MTEATTRARVVDVAVALGAAALAAFLAVRFFLYAGPLWRDEIDALNLSKLPMPDLWAVVDRIGMLPAFPVVLSFWSSLGWTDEDFAMRVLGLVVALATFAGLWLAGRQVSGREPALALALYGTNAMAVVASASGLVYGAGILLVVTTFGAMWALVTAPRLTTFVGTSLCAVVAVQLQYLNLVHVAAMAIAGAAVSLPARQWKSAALAGAVVVLAAASLLPYREAVSRSMTWRALSRNPLDSVTPWSRLTDALSFGSVPVLVAWAGVAAVAIYGVSRLVAAPGGEPRAPHDRVVYALLAAGLAAAGVLLGFARSGPVIMPRHVAALVALLALGLDVAVGRLVPRPARLAIVLVVVAVSFPLSLDRVAVRQTNVDLIGRHLEQAARPGDAIVVNPWFVGPTFDRYYRGGVAWTSIPPIADFTHQRYDLVRERMTSAEPLAPLFARIARTLEGGGRVWFVGPPMFLPPGQPVPVLPRAPGTPTEWFDVPYLVTWSMQTGDFVRRHAVRWSTIAIDSRQPVSPLENLSVLMVEGWAGGGAAQPR